MEIKIKSSSQESMDFLRQFLFENEKEISVEEEYDHTPGFNKEPIVVSIIIALGSAGVFKAVQKMFEAYLKYKTEKLQILSNQEKHSLEQKNQRERDLFKLIIYHNETALEMSEHDFMKTSNIDELKRKTGHNNGS
jgi:hypothetical protein